MPDRADDTAVRVAIARAEVKRAGGLAELKQYATDVDPHVRALALRGLGRIGGDDAMTVLLAATKDPQTAAAAYAAIGVAASLDDTAPLAKQPIVLDGYSARDASAVLEAFGRAAGVDDQAAIIAAVRSRGHEQWADAALALGRMARRKLGYSPEALAWLIELSGSPERDVRYAATYALAREYKPAEATTAQTTAALVARLTDDEPETRAAALAGLAKRNVQPNTTNGALEDSLRDTDWRVAVEAVRTLAGDKGTDVGRALVINNLQRRLDRFRQGHPEEALVIIESLQLVIAHPIEHAPELVAFAAAAQRVQPAVADLAAGEIALLARLAAQSAHREMTLDSWRSDVPEHTRIAISTQAFPRAAPSVQRGLLRMMAESKDVRERAAAISFLPDASPDAVAPDQIIPQLAAAIASKDPVMSGAGADAIASWFEQHGIDPTLGAALVARAGTEEDPDLASGLYDTIAKWKIADGAGACRRALTGHPIAARAGAACLKALGEAVPVPPIGEGVAPPVDVAAVIGRSIEWHLTTTAGPITIKLHPEIAPWAVATIVMLTRKHFYDGLEFHRVVPDFVVQGGDPTMSGVGGPGFTTPAEPATILDGPGFRAGGIGIADAGRDSGGSQWFAMHSRAPHLDGRYTYIGEIVDGQNIADSLVIGSAVTRAEILVR